MLNTLVFCAFTSSKGFVPFTTIGRPRGLIIVMFSNNDEDVGSPHTDRNRSCSIR